MTSANICYLNKKCLCSFDMNQSGKNLLHYMLLFCYEPANILRNKYVHRLQGHSISIVLNKFYNMLVILSF